MGECVISCFTSLVSESVKFALGGCWQRAALPWTNARSLSLGGLVERHPPVDESTSFTKHSVPWKPFCSRTSSHLMSF